MTVYLLFAREDKCQVSNDKHQYRKGRTYTGNKQAKRRRGKTKSSRKLRYIRHGIFRGKYKEIKNDFETALEF